MNENYERTCASSVVIPIVRQIFKRNVELSTKWFERQSQFTNKHHFDAVISIDSVKLNSDMHNKIIHKRRMRASLSNGYLWYQDVRLCCHSLSFVNMYLPLWNMSNKLTNALIASYLAFLDDSKPSYPLWSKEQKRRIDLPKDIDQHLARSCFSSIWTCIV